MFIGHDAVGFASRRFAPRTSLGWLIAAPMLLDLLWPIFLLLGIEHVRIVKGSPNPFLNFEFTDYPWSHSLLMSVVWGALFGACYYAVTRYAAGAWTLSAGVVSHWVLDFVTHQPDLPLYPGGPKVGLGLWNWPGATMLVESLLFVSGIAIYVRSTQPRPGRRPIAFWLLVLFLAVLYLGMMKSKPPDNVQQLAWFGLASFVIPIWAAFAGRAREARG